ncbi:hypothetical protein Gpo141_00005120 [Globisporangium polare]
MGQSASSNVCCCSCLSRDHSTATSDANYKRLDEHGLQRNKTTALSTAHTTSASPSSPVPSLSYRPPSEAQVLPTTSLQRPSPGLLDLAALAFTSTRQDGYPPPFFKRLDQYIRANGYRAHDVFLVLDHDSDQRITADEMLSGFHRVDFQISKREEKTLREWMQQIVGHDLSFKEFALALKQRASLTSPQRISILQLAKP